MFARFTKAIVRPPARNFADGLTTVDLGIPDVELAIAQHGAYCDALARNGCTVSMLEADNQFPDSTFVEDTAFILPGQGAILTRPGANSRAGEIETIRSTIEEEFPGVPQIQSPGTLDAGDVCEAGSHVFIGISHRTNHEGARQLSAWLLTHGVTSSAVDIRAMSEILHLKSGVVAIAPRQLIAIRALALHPAFADFEVITVPDGEEYAANCVKVNDVLFVAAGFPGTHALLRAHGYTLEILDMSEFAKMDGGLSCLSLRF